MIARQLSFLAPAAVMTAWAVVMLHTVASGHINEVLSPMFRNYVVIAAALLVILSVLYVLLYQPPMKTGPALAPTGGLRQFGRWLVLLVPIIAASILSPSALSKTTFNNRALDPNNPANQMPTYYQDSKQVTQTALDADPTQPAPVDVTDLIRLGQEPAQMKAFEGRKVHLVGLMIDLPGTAPRLLRWIMWCCAADAQPAAVELTGNVKGTWKDTDWVEVIGTAHFPTRDGHVVPIVDVDNINPTQEPDEPYLSP